MNISLFNSHTSYIDILVKKILIKSAEPIRGVYIFIVAVPRPRSERYCQCGMRERSDRSGKV